MGTDIDRREVLRRGLTVSAGVAAGGLIGATPTHAAQNDMSIFEAIRSRRSVRNFQDTPVPEADLRQILDAANQAPTPRNRQAWKFVVVRDRVILDRIREICVEAGGEATREYFTAYLSAPVYVAVVADTRTRNPVNDIVAGALAAQNLMLAARAMGYGSVFCVNSIPEAVTREQLRIPDEWALICLTPVGVPDQWPETPAKKSVDDAIILNTF